MKLWKLVLVANAIMASSSTSAALIERLGGLAYYDTEANLTWLADANYAQTIGYDDTIYGENTYGRMTWDDANAWAASLNVSGVTGWRLADTAQPDASCSSFSYGYSCTGSEMGNLFYNVLGGVSGQDIANVHNTNFNLFSNVVSNRYWSATEYEYNVSQAWYFRMYDGYQGRTEKDLWDKGYAWAVFDGDVSPVPVPAAIWLFGSGLLGLASFVRRKKA